MPIEINYPGNGIGVEFKAFGKVTGSDILEAYRQLYAEGQFERFRYKLIDRTECSEYLVSSAEMRMISQQEIDASKINPKMTIIIVAPSAHQFGMSRMFQAMSQESGYDILIFHDRETADSYIATNFHAGGEGP